LGIDQANVPVEPRIAMESCSITVRISLLSLLEHCCRYSLDLVLAIEFVAALVHPCIIVDIMMLYTAALCIDWLLVLMLVKESR
jgi:hypothetical protein